MVGEPRIQVPTLDLSFSKPHHNRGCPTLAFFARVGASSLSDFGSPAFELLAFTLETPRRVGLGVEAAESSPENGERARI